MDLTLPKDGKTIKAESVLEGVDRHILQILKIDEYDELTDSDKKELHKITSPIRESMKQLAGLIKQELYRSDVRDELTGNLSIDWSLGGDQWHPTPRKVTVYLSGYGLGNMNESDAKHLQELL